MPNKFSTRFAELGAEAEKLAGGEKSMADAMGRRGAERFVADDALLNWRVKAKHLIGAACGENSHHMEEMVKAEKWGFNTPNITTLRQMMAIFAAAREDYDGGYITSVRSLVQSEVFGTELAQASELLKSGYITAAAVIAGIVLETALRELSDRHRIPHGKLDRMNADLAKKGVYNLLLQKKITALAQIRNDAAHGNAGTFNGDDVRRMIEDVERFLADHLS